ncbi:MAG: LytTR family DNA-binding domain-containing protein [Pseudomonadota bacterium]
MAVGTLSRSERLLAEAGIIAMLGCILAVTGLFNHSGMELGARMAVWIGGLLAAWVLFGLMGEVGKAIARLVGIGTVWGYVIAIPLATVLISWVLLWWLGGSDAMLGSSFADIWPQTIAIAVGIFLLFFALYYRSSAGAQDTSKSGEIPTSKAAAAPDKSGVSETELHGRLPPAFPPILALSVEDHYVHAVAADRREMVLMPLNEAISLMPEGSGQQVHRSWWVARSALRGHKREGRDVRLVLTNGLSVPVSRALVSELRDNGWLS